MVLPANGLNAGGSVLDALLCLSGNLLKGCSSSNCNRLVAAAPLHQKIAAGPIRKQAPSG